MLQLAIFLPVRHTRQAKLPEVKASPAHNPIIYLPLRDSVDDSPVLFHITYRYTYIEPPLIWSIQKIPNLMFPN